MIANQQRYLRLAIAVVCALAAAMAAIVLIEYFGRAFLSSRMASEESGSTLAEVPSTAQAGGPAQMSLHDTPQVMPGFRFEDGNGRSLTLADFAGKVVLLNIWATWCIPCREEMPTLDRLQAELGGPEFEVVALPIDRGGLEAVQEFFSEIGIERLAVYLDRSGKAANVLGAVGLPTTLLIDREGRELGRLVGPAEWDAPEMLDAIRGHLTSRTGAATPERRKRAARHETADKALGRLDLPVAGIPI